MAETGELVDARFRRIADAAVRFERRVPVFLGGQAPPTLSVENVDRLADGTA